MKNLMLTLMLLMAAVGNSFAEGEKSELPLADPYIFLEGDTYYAYGTHSNDGIEVWTSTDLTTWSYRQLALNKANTTEPRWFWAPEVYNFDGTYYMYYSANEHLYVATAKSPLGPFRQVGGYMMNDVLGNEKCIDSSVFTDDDGKQWIFFVRFTDGNCIWQCRLSDDHITPIKATLNKCFGVTQDWEKKLGRVCEGPNVVKRNGFYYLTYSGNDYRSQDYAVGYARARTLGVPSWSKRPGNPILHGVEGLVGTGHHSIFTDKEGKLRIVFHAHDSRTSVDPRRTYIGTLQWDGNDLNMSSEPIIRPKKESATGIDNVNTSTQSARPSRFYNLSGQEVSSSTKGLLLVKQSDGKWRKVVRR